MSPLSQPNVSPPATAHNTEVLVSFTLIPPVVPNRMATASSLPQAPPPRIKATPTHRPTFNPRPSFSLDSHSHRCTLSTRAVTKISKPRNQQNDTSLNTEPTQLHPLSLSTPASCARSDQAAHLWLPVSTPTPRVQTAYPHSGLR